MGIVSTRGRYALRVMVDLAEHNDEGYIPLNMIAERQELPLKYLEQIMISLTKSGLVEGMRGKGGGYRLAREPVEYTAGEILRVTEGKFSPVACRVCGGGTCARSEACKMLPMWREFCDMTNDYFDRITLAELLQGDLIPPRWEQ